MLFSHTKVLDADTPYYRRNKTHVKFVNTSTEPGRKLRKMKAMEVSQYSSSCGLEEKACVGWAKEFFGDCLCNLKDGLSFGFGMASLVCWCVADIPQIITNFKNKSADGVSLAFISTWIIGDVFNLIGCILEPATLPTQYYAALLCIPISVVLALQCLYYDHFLPLWRRSESEENKLLLQDNDERSALTQKVNDRRRRVASKSENPSEVPRRKDFYFISARSLAGSNTSSTYSHIKPKSSASTVDHYTESSSEKEATTPALSHSKPSSQPRPIPRPVGYGTFLAASAFLPRATKGSQLRLIGRRILQEQEPQSSRYGQLLGWLMAATYMGGRVPQIWLNIKRGSVEGLNPLMFIFALIASATYAGSILVRSTEWEKIKANMPWLLDALVCVALDLFIILQYIFYRCMKRNKCGKRFGKYYEDYVEPKYDKSQASS